MAAKHKERSKSGKSAVATTTTATPATTTYVNPTFQCQWYGPIKEMLDEEAELLGLTRRRSMLLLGQIVKWHMGLMDKPVRANSAPKRKPLATKHKITSEHLVRVGIRMDEAAEAWLRQRSVAWGNIPISAVTSMLFLDWLGIAPPLTPPDKTDP